MRFLPLFLILGGIATAAPDCQYKYRFTNRAGEPTDGLSVLSGATAAATINNTEAGCVGWSLMMSSEGFSGISLALQTAPRTYQGLIGASTPGSWSTFSGTDVLGTLPIIATTSYAYIGYSYFPFLRVNLATATGTGSVEVTLLGWKSTTYLTSIGGGTSAGALAGSGLTAVGSQLLVNTALILSQATAQAGTPWDVVPASASSTTYTANVVPSILAYTPRQFFKFKPDVDSGTAPTLDLNGLGPLALKYDSGAGTLTAIPSGWLKSTRTYLIYTTTTIDAWVIIDPSILPNPAASRLGGIKSKTCNLGDFFNDFTTTGDLGCSTPAGGSSTGLVYYAKTATDVSLTAATHNVVYNSGSLGQALPAGSCFDVEFWYTAPSNPATTWTPEFGFGPSGSETIFALPAFAVTTSGGANGDIISFFKICNNSGSQTAQQVQGWSNRDTYGGTTGGSHGTMAVTASATTNVIKAYINPAFGSTATPVMFRITVVK